MKHIFKLMILLPIGAILIFSGCKNKDRFLTSITGSAFEVLVVAETKTWKNEAGNSLLKKLDADMPSLPQAEPYLSVSWCTPADFNSMLKPTRSIILVDINNQKYTKGRIQFLKDQWAASQAVVKIAAPDDSTFINLMNERGMDIVNYIVKMELNRIQNAFKENNNANFSRMAYDQFGISMAIPSNLNMYKQGENMLWFSNGSDNQIQQNILIYSYPYTDKKMLTKDALLAKRDSIVKEFIPGQVENSYMGTEYRYDKPSFTEIWMNDRYCAEIRGLWKMYGGMMMGGPFISHTRIDELHQRVVTVEGFIFAPASKKRNYIRQLEAVLHTVKVSQLMDEVVISAK